MGSTSNGTGDLSVITKVIARNRRGALILAGLGPVLALIGLLTGSRPALLGLSGAGLVCMLIALGGFWWATRTGQAIIRVLRDRPDAITTIATVTVRHRTNSGITLSREHAILIGLDDGNRYSLRSLTADDQTTILDLLHRLVPNARHVTGQV